MFFYRKKNLVGVDIGSSMIKVGEIIPKKNRFVLNKFGTYNLPPNMINEGEISDFNVVADAISTLFQELNIKNTNVAVSVGGYSIITKIVNVDVMTNEELKNNIQFEIEQDIPNGLDTVNIDYHLIETVQGYPDQMRVIVVAIKKKIVDDYISLMKMAKLNLCVLDVDSFAMQNSYERVYDVKNNDIVVLIDIGASKSSITILQGKSPLAIVDVELGTFQIDEEIIKITNCTAEEARQIRYGSFKEKISLSVFNDIQSLVIANWCFEIQKIIQTSCFDVINQDYISQTSSNKLSMSNKQNNIKKIIIGGGGSNIDDFTARLSKEMSIDVEIIDPFKELIIDKKLFDLSSLQKISSRAAVCLGLAQRNMDDK